MFSNNERKSLIEYLSNRIVYTRYPDQLKTIIYLLEKNKDREVIEWCIKNEINLMEILNISFLRYKLLCSNLNSQESPWFFREIGLLPIICGCKRNCIVNQKICTDLKYLNFLVDQLERNHHRIETADDKIMLFDAINAIQRQLIKIKNTSSHINKKVIDQAIEKLILIKEIQEVNQKSRKNYIPTEEEMTYF